MTTVANWLKEQFCNLVYLAEFFCAINLFEQKKNQRDTQGYKIVPLTNLKEEALDRTMWTVRFGRGFEPVVRQTTK